MAVEAAEEDNRVSLSQDTAELARALWATILGLAFARCSVIIGSYGSYRATDYGLYTDGATLVSMALLLVGLLVMVVRKDRMRKRQVGLLMRITVVLQIAVLCFMTLLAADTGIAVLESLNNDVVHYVLHVANTVLGIIMFSFWLRYMRGANAFTTVGLVATALIISEIVLLVSAFIPHPISYALAAVLSFAEFPLMWQSRKVPRPYEVEIAQQQLGLLLSFANETGEKDNPAQRKFLADMGIGIGVLSIVIGLLRGYPDGASIPFTPQTRIAYFVIIVALMVLALRSAHCGRIQLVTLDAWVVMQALACASLLLYVFFPDALEIGAVTTTVLNAVMVGFTWYAIVAFASYGWRDPFYYAIGGLAVFLVPRAGARLAEMLLFQQLGVNATQIAAFIACGLVLASQIGFVQTTKLYDIMRDKQREEEVAKEKSNFLERFMGLNNEDAPESLEDLRLRAMQGNAAAMGETFMLSDREVEVLALYAMGHTQKKVAEELFISPGTVHAHIKRIYEKTGLHSRQAILDYMDKLGEQN